MGIDYSIVEFCDVEGKHTETGAGKSKKLAKRQAANKMIQKLRDLPTENEGAFLNIDDDELAQGEGILMPKLISNLCFIIIFTQGFLKDIPK